MLVDDDRETFMYAHLEVFKESFQGWHHDNKLSRSFWRAKFSLAEFREAISLASSANKKINKNLKAAVVHVYNYTMFLILALHQREFCDTMLCDFSQLLKLIIRIV